MSLISNNKKKKQNYLSKGIYLSRMFIISISNGLCNTAAQAHKPKFFRKLYQFNYDNEEVHLASPAPLTQHSLYRKAKQFNFWGFACQFSKGNI